MTKCVHRDVTLSSGKASSRRDNSESFKQSSIRNTSLLRRPTRSIMSLAEYLAKNYLTADPSPTEAKSKKKRKRKDLSTATNGLVIADDDASGWDNRKDEKDDEDGPITGN
jgi:hypothetical protein